MESIRRLDIYQKITRLSKKVEKKLSKDLPSCKSFLIFIVYKIKNMIEVKIIEIVILVLVSTIFGMMLSLVISNLK